MLKNSNIHIAEEIKIEDNNKYSSLRMIDQESNEIDYSSSRSNRQSSP